MSGLRPALAVIIMFLVVGVVGVALFNSSAKQPNDPKHGAVTLASQAPLCAPREDNPQRLILPKGVQVVDFELNDLDGKRVRLGEQLANGPVLLEFFATWCPHCQHSVETLHAIHNSGKVQVIAVNAGEQPGQPSTAANFKAEHDIPYTILDAPSDTLIDKFCLEGFPLFYLLDSKGTVVWQHVGVLDKDHGVKELNAAIAGLK